MGKFSKNIKRVTIKEFKNFIKYVNIGNLCWIWNGAKVKQGYGYKAYNGKNVRAHRLLYCWLFGNHNKLLVLDHLCKNTSCVNPSHLEVVSRGENVLRGNGITAKNLKKTHCPKGHKYTPKNTIIHSKAGSRMCRTCNVIMTQKWRKNN